jgi:hypothetical protein
MLTRDSRILDGMHLRFIPVPNNNRIPLPASVCLDAIMTDDSQAVNFPGPHSSDNRRDICRRYALKSALHRKMPIVG